MMVLATLFLSLAGFAVLALSMRRHHRELFGEPPRPARTLTLQVVGWGLLALSLIPAISGWGASIGIALWLGVATVSVLVVALVITYRSAHRLRLQKLAVTDAENVVPTSYRL